MCIVANIKSWHKLLIVKVISQTHTHETHTPLLQHKPRNVCVYVFMQTAVVPPVRCQAPAPRLPLRLTPPHASASVRRSPSRHRAARRSTRPRTTTATACPPHLHSAALKPASPLRTPTRQYHPPSWRDPVK